MHAVKVQLLSRGHAEGVCVLGTSMDPDPPASIPSPAIPRLRDMDDHLVCAARFKIVMEFNRATMRSLVA